MTRMYFHEFLSRDSHGAEFFNKLLVIDHHLRGA